MKKKTLIIITLLIIGSSSLYFSHEIQDLLASTVNFSIKIKALPNQNNNNNNNIIAQTTSNQPPTSTNNSNPKIIFSGDGCPKGEVTLKVNDQNSKTTKTTTGKFTITKSLTPKTYNFEISCKNSAKKITKKIQYTKIKLTKNQTKNIENISLKETITILKKPAIAIKSRKPRIFKSTLKNF